MGGAASPARMPRPERLASIGAVLDQLTEDFPDLTPSKLRFLEEQGLISPARTEAGYRKFSHSDVERIRRILAMQREQYLPLKVIRAHLEQLDAGHVPTLPSAVPMLPAGRRFERDELLREAGASAQLLDDAIAASLIAPAEVFGEDAVVVLRALVELRASGIEPRHLRGLRASVERDAALIDAAMTPLAKRADSPSRSRAADAALELAGRLDVVRASLLRSAITRGTGATR
jgi:DNA-binding transcriptional MerR regulator